MHGSATPDVGGDLPFLKIRKEERKTWRPWNTKPSVWFNGLRTPLVLISLSILLLHILALSALDYTSLRQLRHPASLHSRHHLVFIGN